MNTPRTGGEPTSDEVLEALSKTGFLFEQKVARTLNKRSFHSIPGFGFEDADEGKSREIDVLAYRQFFRDDQLRQYVATRVIVECKNTQNPYAVIGQPPDEHERKRVPEEHRFRIPTITRHFERDHTRYAQNIPSWEWFGLHKASAGPAADTFRGNQLVRLDRKGGKWDASNSAVFDSHVYPLIKALRAVQAPGSLSRLSHQEWSYIELCFPVIVTNGPIFRIDTKDASNPSVQKVPWTTVARDLKTSSIKGKFNIDVTSYEHLDSYIENRVEAFAHEVCDLVKKDPKALLIQDTELESYVAPT